MNSVDSILEQQTYNDFEIISDINIIKLNTIKNCNSEWIWCLLFNNSKLYVGGYDGKICIYDKNFILENNIYSKQFIQSLVVYNDILICGGFTCLTIYDIIKNHKEILIIEEYHNDTISKLKIINKYFLISVSYDKKIKIWDLRNFNIILTYNFNEPIYSLEVLNNKIFVGSNKNLGVFKFINSKFKFIRKIKNLHKNIIYNIILYKKNYIVTVSEDKTFKFIDINSYKTIINYEWNFCLKGISILKNYIFIIGKCHDLHILELVEEKFIQTYKIIKDIHNDWINCINFNNNKLVIGSDDCAISIYKIETKTDHQINNIMKNLNKLKNFNKIQMKLNFDSNITVKKLENKFQKLDIKFQNLEKNYNEKILEIKNLKCDLKEKNNLILSLKNEINYFKNH